MGITEEVSLKKLSANYTDTYIMKPLTTTAILSAILDEQEVLCRQMLSP